MLRANPSMHTVSLAAYRNRAERIEPQHEATSMRWQMKHKQANVNFKSRTLRGSGLSIQCA